MRNGERMQSRPSGFLDGLPASCSTADDREGAQLRRAFLGGPDGRAARPGGPRGGRADAGPRAGPARAARGRRPLERPRAPRRPGHARRVSLARRRAAPCRAPSTTRTRAGRAVAHAGTRVTPPEVRPRRHRRADRRRPRREGADRLRRRGRRAKTLVVAQANLEPEWSDLVSVSAARRPPRRGTAPARARPDEVPRLVRS
jgi:hypothetical protein